MGASTSEESGIRRRKVTIQKFKEAAPVVRFLKSQGVGILTCEGYGAGDGGQGGMPVVCNN